MRTATALLAMILGLVLGLVGVSFSAMYVVNAIVRRMGDPDQSLLFWYLPVLLIGIVGIVIGVFLLIWGVKRLQGAAD